MCRIAGSELPRGLGAYETLCIAKCCKLNIKLTCTYFNPVHGFFTSNTLQKMPYRFEDALSTEDVRYHKFTVVVSGIKCSVPLCFNARMHLKKCCLYQHVIFIGFIYRNMYVKGKGSFYIAQYPVRWTAQRALHFLPPLADLFIPTPTRLLREAF